MNRNPAVFCLGVLVGGLYMFLAGPPIAPTFAQCAVTAPAAASVALSRVCFDFNLPDAGCVGSAIGTSALTISQQPAPSIYPPSNVNLCPLARVFGRGALLTDLGRGDGGPP